MLSAYQICYSLNILFFIPCYIHVDTALKFKQKVIQKLYGPSSCDESSSSNEDGIDNRDNRQFSAGSGACVLAGEAKVNPVRKLGPQTCPPDFIQATSSKLSASLQPPDELVLSDDGDDEASGRTQQ